MRMSGKGVLLYLAVLVAFFLWSYGGDSTPSPGEPGVEAPCPEPPKFPTEEERKAAHQKIRDDVRESMREQFGPSRAWDVMSKHLDRPDRTR